MPSRSRWRPRRCARFMGRDAVIATLRDVREREATMARAIDVDRLVTMGTLAAGVAHEINSPLSYVQASLDFLAEVLGGEGAKVQGQSEDASEEDEDLHAALRDARRGVARAIEITRDLKAIGRREAEDEEVLDPRQAVEGALRWARAEVMQIARLEIELDVCGSVIANRRRLSQVVLNLIVNAAHAMSAETRPNNVVSVRTYAADEHALIEVRDNGSGITPEALARVFEPFYTTKEPDQGTGLGLFVSRDIVERFGGSLQLESEPGRGTCAIIRLPHHRESQAREAEATAS